MTDINELTQNPSAIEAQGTPPNPRRLGQRAGWLAALVLMALLGAIMYGTLTRKGAFEKEAAQKTDKVAPATNAALEIRDKIGDGNYAQREESTPDKREAREQPTEPPKLPQYTAQVGQQVSSGVNHNTLSPEERLREEAFQRQQEALRAGTKIGADGLKLNKAAGQPDMTQLAALSAALGGGVQGNGTGASGVDPRALLAASMSAGGMSDDGYGAQNNQKDKIEFNNQAASIGNNYLKASRNAALSPYEIKAGWDIPAVLDQGVNSDLPGEMHAVVRENVYDTATGRFLLIPKGSRLLGRYNSNISYGQERVQVAWHRIIYPDASSIDLGSMVGQDASGYAGFSDQVNNHWGRLIGAAVLSSLFSAGYEISQNGKRQSYGGGQSSQDAAAAAVGAEVSRVGGRVMQRSLNIQPTLEIRPGYRFNVRVNKDILFSAPYEPMPPVNP